MQEAAFRSIELNRPTRLGQNSELNYLIEFDLNGNDRKKNLLYFRTYFYFNTIIHIFVVTKHEELHDTFGLIISIDYSFLFFFSF